MCIRDSLGNALVLSIFPSPSKSHLYDTAPTVRFLNVTNNWAQPVSLFTEKLISGERNTVIESFGTNETKHPKESITDNLVLKT